MYHANVTKVEWHPSHPELLLVRCEGEGYNNLVFVWDPLSNGPRPIDFSRHLPSRKVTSRTDATWLKTTTESAAVFFTNHAEYILVSLADSAAQEALPWANNQATLKPHLNTTDIRISNNEPIDESSTDMDEEMSELDDTFQFKKSPLP
jgi:hypothetical protein